MIPRNYYTQKIEHGFEYNPIVILVGARQVGKTSLMEMFSSEKKTLWLHGQNPEEAKLFETFSAIEHFLKINLGEELNGMLIIDEFQYIDGISRVLKLLADKHKNLKILCSGSSSLQIMQSVEESLAGRVRSIPVYPLSFKEYLKFQNEEIWEKYCKLKPMDDFLLFLPQIDTIFQEYLVFGGLPKVALAKNEKEKKELLNDIYQTYLLKDVKQFIENKDFVAFNKLLKLLASQIGNLLNINEISNTIQLPYRACEEYVNVLDQMYILHLIHPFSTNNRKVISKMKKLYFCDIGLRNAIYNSFNEIDIRVDRGAIFENYVFMQLLMSHKANNICFYRTKDKTEIDFIVDKENKIIPIEAKFKTFNDNKKIRAITEFEKHTSIEKSYIINKNLIKQQSGQHYIQPFMLEEI